MTAFPSPHARLLAGAAAGLIGVAALACSSALGSAVPRALFAHLLGTALTSGPTPLVPVATWDGRAVAWIARGTDGVTLLAFDQHALELHLHSGTEDAGPTGWRYGPQVSSGESPRLLFAFNSGFKFVARSGGFLSYGRTGAPLKAGLGSVVTYANGTTDIGTWGSEVPRAGLAVASVRQNLKLLIDHGRADADVNCLLCWGATLGGVVDPARSALGITADGRLIWAAGEHLTVPQLADELLRSHVVRAVELDINPAWVAGYLYGHRGGRGPLAPVPVVAGQVGISGQYLTPWTRDFFTVVTR